MNRRIDFPNAVPFLEEFTEKHRGEPVKLQVLEGTTPMTEEEGLRLVGLDLDRKGRGALSVQIMLGDEASQITRHLTHTVPQLSGLVLEVGADGQDERLTIESETGTKVILILG